MRAEEELGRIRPGPDSWDRIRYLLSIITGSEDATESALEQIVLDYTRANVNQAMGKDS